MTTFPRELCFRSRVVLPLSQCGTRWKRASDRARPGVFRVLPQRRDEAVTGLGRRARQGATGGRGPSGPAPFTLLSVSYARRRLDGSGPTARGRGGELGPRAVARPRPLGQRQRR